MRTPITDGTGKPWVFRYKDIKSWWLNQHFNRPGGVESPTPTAWVPQSKPFWISEIGCPAVDKGANQPNVFVDPKSSESFYPYFSRRNRDDLMQRMYHRAFVEAFDPQNQHYISGLNPISSITGQRMLDLNHVYAYAWDARPYPAFPRNTSFWSDGDNWRLGHWLNGRYDAALLAELVRALLEDYGFTDHDTHSLSGTVPGYVIDRIMSARDALGPLELAFFFDALETEQQITFRHRGASPSLFSVTRDSLVEERANVPLLTLTRAQETDLPAQAKVMFVAQQGDYHKAVAEARRLTGASGRVAQAELPIVLGFEQASEIAESWLFETWTARERMKFTLPPSALDVEPGDVITVVHQDQTRDVRIVDIDDNIARTVEARAIDQDVYSGVVPGERETVSLPTTVIGSPIANLINLPLLTGSEDPDAGYFATFQDPWPGGVALYSSPEETGYTQRALATAPTVMGETRDDLAEGPGSRLNKGARVTIELLGGELNSVAQLQLLSGKNAAALETSTGDWEVIQFEEAVLVSERTYELRNLLRGQAGTEHLIEETLAAGARFVLLGTDVTTVSMTSAERGLPLNWRYGPATRDVSDATYRDETHAFIGLGWAPLSPVKVSGARANEDLEISWIRRTRIGGDTWEAPEVPLGETDERYEIDILSGDTVLRTLTATSPSILYTATDQTTDFGSPQSSVSVAIYQMSDVYGRGTPARAIL